MLDEEGRIDYFGTAVIAVFVTAAVGDVLFWLILPHYIAGIVVAIIAWSALKGWMSKLLMILCILLPLPLLVIGTFFSLLLSNKLIQFIAEQAAIQAIAVATAGAGEALEAGAVAAEVGEAGVAAVEAGEAAAAVAEGAAAAAEAGEVAAGAAEAGEAAAGAGEGTAGAAGAGEEQTLEEKAREKVLKKIFEQGSQQSPEEEAEEEDFEPQDAQFNEAPSIEEGINDEEEAA